MMRLILFLLFVFSFLSLDAQVRKQRKQKVIYDQCGPLVVGDNTQQVSVLIEYYYPYCGGAAPDESQLNNVQPQRATQFILCNLDTKEESVVVTDSTGRLNLNLVPGKYGVKEMYKNCSFKEFLEKFPPVQNDYYMSMDEECYKTWWSSYLLEFTVHGSGTIPANLRATISEACFTGVNPCVFYTGPWPP